MGSPTSIGIYISPEDKDIAAWFNLLERNHMSRTVWVRGLLAAYALEQPLRIGIIDKKAPLIRDKDNPSDTVTPKGSFQYGWHIRGPHREYVIGSVINLTIRNAELRTVLDEAWANGHKLATFIKSLIRKNLKTGDKDIPPKMDEYNRIWAEFLVSVNKNMTKVRKERELPHPEPVKPAAPDTSWVTEKPTESELPSQWEPRQILGRSGKAVVPSLDRSFAFTDDEKVSAPAETPIHETQKAAPVPPPAPKKSPALPPSLGKNPLLDQI